MVPPDEWNMIQRLKEMSYRVMKRHEGNLNAYYQNERSHSEKATCYMILVYDILGKANYGDNIKIRGCQRLVEGAGGRAQRISRAVKLLGMIL